jgi:hypothetical protein
MNRFKFAFRFLLGVVVLADAFAQTGCSSEETPSVAAGKASRRDEAGKSFPFPEGGSPAKGAADSHKTR